MRSIENVAQLDAYLADVQRETMSALVRGTTSGLTLVADEMAEDAPHNPNKNDYKGLPWNLAASVGVDDRIPAQTAKIPGLAERRNFKVKVTATGVEGVLAVAMLYADKLKNYPGWYVPALSRAEKVIGQEHERELDAVPQRVG